jgi:DNA repair exonuclease SbcCD ATPase subunit
MNPEGFSDLRLNTSAQSQENFWPSFTDIMTVIVMIFLIAMVVLLVRNMELVTQLRATMEAERIAAELARATGAEKESLSSALDRAEERVQRLQLELMRMRDDRERNTALIAEQLREITGLANQRDDLARQAAQLTALRESLANDVRQRESALADALARIDDQQARLSTSERMVTGLEASLAQLRERYAASQQQAEELRQTVQRQRTDLDAAREKEAALERRYLVLADEFDSLQVKYDELFKPARSSAGRRLVEVRYWKTDGDYRIAWREGSDADFQAITRTQLDNVLTRLDARSDDGLYVRVIIPEDSGLSYNEAWTFTSYLHGKYDYYFKSGPGKSGPGKSGPGKSGPGKSGPGKSGPGKSGPGKSGTDRSETPPAGAATR